MNISSSQYLLIPTGHMETSLWVSTGFCVCLHQMLLPQSAPGAVDPILISWLPAISFLCTGCPGLYLPLGRSLHPGPDWLLFSCQVVSLQQPYRLAYQASLSFTVSQSLPKFMSIKSVMPSNHLILYHPLLLLTSVFYNIRVFSKESALHIRWPKYWRFGFSINPFNEYSGLISLKLTGLISLLSKQLSRVFSNTTV